MHVHEHGQKWCLGQSSATKEPPPVVAEMTHTLTPISTCHTDGQLSTCSGTRSVTQTADAHHEQQVSTQQVTGTAAAAAAVPVRM